MNLLKVEDIENAEFRRSNVRGYNSDDVDNFLDRVSDTFRAQVEEINELKKKLSMLAKVVEKYKSEEDSIKNTLLNAQKIADVSIREAQHKAEVITRDAEAKAQEVVGDIEERCSRGKEEFERLQKEVLDFKRKILEQYREHIHLVGAISVKEDIEKSETKIEESPKDQAQQSEEKAVGSSESEDPSPISSVPEQNEDTE